MNRFAKRKRGVLLGFGTAAAVLALTSTAYACTVYMGKATVSDVNAGVTSTASADGSGGTTYHEFCLPGGQIAGVQAQQPVDLTGTFTVTVGATTLCTTANTAPQNTYTMRWATPKPNVNTDEVYLRGHCNSNDNNLEYLNVSGTIGVSSAGTGSATVTVPSTFIAGPAAVCFLGPDPTGDPSPPEVRLLVI